jgi:hypothetical protein
VAAQKSLDARNLVVAPALLSQWQSANKSFGGRSGSELSPNHCGQERRQRHVFWRRVWPVLWTDNQMDIVGCSDICANYFDMPRKKGGFWQRAPRNRGPIQAFRASAQSISRGLGGVRDKTRGQYRMFIFMGNDLSKMPSRGRGSSRVKSCSERLDIWANISQMPSREGDVLARMSKTCSRCSCIWKNSFRRPWHEGYVANPWQ